MTECMVTQFLFCFCFWVGKPPRQGGQRPVRVFVSPSPNAVARSFPRALPLWLFLRDGVTPQKFQGEVSAPVLQTLTGHRNEATVKGVVFYGAGSEFVASGSDCGNVFIWDSVTGDVVTVLKDADSYAINCIAPNPHDMTIVATSGIDHDVKVWHPDGVQGNGVDEEEVARLVRRNEPD